MTDIPENAPTHCPGTESEMAGQANACAGCPNQQICSSGAPQEVDPDEEVITQKMDSIKNKIVVLSGKGGVGKSTFTSTLSRLLARDSSNEVGVLDVDICGPSQPRILGAMNESVHSSGSGWSPVYVGENLSLMSIGFLLNSPEDAVIWRGPKKNGMIKQFLKDVDWGPLTHLVLDTPPGTSDEHLSLAKYLCPKNRPNRVGAVIVTTPQEISLLDVRKEITFCRKVNLPIIGLVENMSYFICPNCKNESVIFPATTGGGRALCQELSVPFLGSVPLDPIVARSCDEGGDIFEEFPQAEVCRSYNHIAKGVIEYFHQLPDEAMA